VQVGVPAANVTSIAQTLEPSAEGSLSPLSSSSVSGGSSAVGSEMDLEVNLQSSNATQLEDLVAEVIDTATAAGGGMAQVIGIQVRG
jgi:hypothetical protein